MPRLLGSALEGDRHADGRAKIDGAITILFLSQGLHGPIGEGCRLRHESQRFGYHPHRRCRTALSAPQRAASIVVAAHIRAIGARQDGGCRRLVDSKLSGRRLRVQRHRVRRWSQRGLGLLASSLPRGGQRSRRRFGQPRWLGHLAAVGRRRTRRLGLIARSFSCGGRRHRGRRFGWHRRIGGLATAAPWRTRGLRACFWSNAYFFWRPFLGCPLW